MAYTLIHKIWFPNRDKFGKSLIGITPSSEYMFTEEEIKTYKTSMTLMSSALMNVSTQVTDNQSTLVAMAGTDQSYTDGHNIVVGTNPMNEHQYDIYKGMDILMGLACHESCHCAYTDFKDFSLDEVMEYPIGKWLSNLYEDECIEEMLIKKNKQWAFFLDNVVSHYFSYEKLMPQLKKAVKSGQKIHWAQIMLLVMVRNSDLSRWFPREWLDELGPMLDEIYEKVIVKLNDPSFFAYSPTSVVNKQTIETIKIMKKYISDDMLSKEVDMKQGMLGNSSSETSSRKQFGKGKKPSQRRKEAATARGKQDIGLRNKMMKAVEAMKNEKNSKNYDPVTGLFKNATSNIGARKANDVDKKMYDRIKSLNKEEISIAKKIIIPSAKKIEYEMDKFHRNGQLISSHLAQAIQGVNCVYQRKVMKRSEDQSSPKYALVLAIDESGSMFFPSTIKMRSDRGLMRSAELASELAIIMYEAMRDFPDIDLYVYGHADTIVRYVTPREDNPYKLSTLKYNGGQNEAVSYDAIYKDVRLQTNKPILFFNITDSNYLASQDSIKTISEKMKKENCILSLMTIPNECYSGDPRLESAIKFNDEVYGKDNWVHLDKTKTLKDGLIQLSKIFRKNLNKYRR